MPINFTFNPKILDYAAANVVAGAVTYPSIGGLGVNYLFPKANTRQVTILNTGGTTLWFGSRFADIWGQVPPPFNPAGVGIIPGLGINCTAIPAGASFTLELETFERRGQFDPNGGFAPWNQADFQVSTFIFFAAPPATNASCVVTYVSTNGPF